MSGILLTRVWALCMLPSCHLLLHVLNLSQQTETTRYSKLASPLSAHRSFPIQPVLVVASSFYLGKLHRPSSIPTEFSYWYFQVVFLPLLALRYVTMLGNKFTVCLPTSHIPPVTLTPPTVVQDFSALPGCYAASVPAIIAGYWSAFLYFQISHCIQLTHMQDCARYH